jgi:hypothetical protein
MFEAFEKIPKGVNIIIFIWAIIGLFLLLMNPKVRKEKLFWVFLAVAGFMVFWRILFGIDSSRYAAGLILPFTVSASYLVCTAGRKKHLPIRIPLCIALVCSGFILVKMNTDSVFRNYESDIVSEVFKDFERDRDIRMFRAPWKDFSRILFSSRLGGKLKATAWDDEHESEKVHKYLVNYDIAYPDTVYNIDSRTIEDDAEVWDILKSKHTQIASLVEDARRNKRQLIFLLSSDNHGAPVSENGIPPYRPNLLDNGDLEELDSPEESGAKNKEHIGCSYADKDATAPTFRTPRNAYFSFEADATSLPEVNMQNAYAIAGGHSARIRAGKDAAACLMFDKRFPNGKYDYSMLIKGETGTNVAILCEIGRDDGGRETRQVGSFVIPDRRLFLITTHFSVEDLDGEDYFRAGVSVQKGEAYFDNFSLTPAASGAAAESGSGAD